VTTSHQLKKAAGTDKAAARQTRSRVMISSSPPVVLGLVLSVTSTRETIRELVQRDLSVSN
jgi:hypothetical protein